MGRVAQSAVADGRLTGEATARGEIVAEVATRAGDGVGGIKGAFLAVTQGELTRLTDSFLIDSTALPAVRSASSTVKRISVRAGQTR